MTTKEFIEAFNKSGQTEKARLIVDNNLRDPGQHLICPLIGDAPYASIHILGYTQIRVGIWYVTKCDGSKVIMSAFRLHSSGVATYREFVKVAPNNRFTNSIRKKFIESFDYFVAPLCADN